MIKNIITKVKREPIYGDRCGVSNNEFYFPYIGSKIYIKLFGLLWVRYKHNILINKNH